MLTAFELDMLTAFNKQSPENVQRVNGSGLRDQRKAAIWRLVALGLLEEKGPFAFRITHEGHTLLDNLKGGL